MSRPRRPRLRFSLSELSAIACNSCSTKRGTISLRVDDPRITNIGNPAVDNHTGVEHQRSSALDLLGKFDVGNDEAKFVLGLQQGGDGDVTANHGDEQPQRHRHGQGPGFILHAEHRLQPRPDQRAEQETQQQAEVDGGDGGDLLVADQNVDNDGNGTSTPRTQPKATKTKSDPGSSPENSTRRCVRWPGTTHDGTVRGRATTHQTAFAEPPATASSDTPGAEHTAGSAQTAARIAALADSSYTTVIGWNSRRYSSWA